MPCSVTFVCGLYSRSATCSFVRLSTAKAEDEVGCMLITKLLSIQATDESLYSKRATYSFVRLPVKTHDEGVGCSLAVQATDKCHVPWPLSAACKVNVQLTLSSEF